VDAVRADGAAVAQPVAEIPVDELPNGLPLFNLFLHLPAFDARLQLFRMLRGYVLERFTLHTMLVHPEDVDRIPALAGALGFFQAHGEVWLLAEGAVRDRPALTLGRVGRPVEYAVVRSPDGDRLCLVDAAGRVAAEADRDAVLCDDLTKVRLLRECFLAEYPDHALSMPFIRPYPGLTSLIRQGRRFDRLFRTDPVGPGTRFREPWVRVAGVATGW
jgi:hypothetical protein